mmetsp:Transcript_123596/g.394888  ORF Transcript_123596/g.394888 Transcript_123596/m.394888 type:complete len:337 (-) Transcript_123596:247-1257(-)
MQRAHEHAHLRLRLMADLMQLRLAATAGTWDEARQVQQGGLQRAELPMHGHRHGEGLRGHRWALHGQGLLYGDGHRRQARAPRPQRRAAQAAQRRATEAATQAAPGAARRGRRSAPNEGAEGRRRRQAVLARQRGRMPARHDDAAVAPPAHRGGDRAHGPGYRGPERPPLQHRAPCAGARGSAGQHRAHRPRRAHGRRLDRRRLHLQLQLRARPREVLQRGHDGPGRSRRGRRPPCLRRHRELQGAGASRRQGQQTRVRGGRRRLRDALPRDAHRRRREHAEVQGGRVQQRRLGDVLRNEPRCLCDGPRRGHEARLWARPRLLRRLDGDNLAHGQM